MGRARKLSAKAALSLVEKGYSVAEIAKCLGVSYQAIRYHLTSNGLTRPKCPACGQYLNKKLDALPSN